MHITGQLMAGRQTSNSIGMYLTSQSGAADSDLQSAVRIKGKRRRKRERRGPPTDRGSPTGSNGRFGGVIFGMRIQV